MRTRTGQDGRRRVVVVHADEWTGWMHTRPHLPDVSVKRIDVRLLEGRDGLPGWVRRPGSLVKAARGHLAEVRRSAVAQWVRHLTGDDGRALVIWTDQERLPPRRLEELQPWHEVFREHATVLNHPTRSKRRLALLQAFHEQGLNDFRAVRASDPAARELRLPVFLRRDDDHMASRHLVETPEELDRALRNLETEFGHPDRWIVVEKLDVPKMFDRTPKYSAYALGDRIVPRHLLFGEGWVVKTARDIFAGGIETELAYLRDNPHADELRKRFRAAGIQYGRIDYAIVDGRVQTFEINTNPIIFRSTSLSPDNPRRGVHGHFIEQWNAAIRDFDPAADLPAPSTAD